VSRWAHVALLLELRGDQAPRRRVGGKERAHEELPVGIELLGLLCALALAQPIRRPRRRPVLGEVTR
jgi:hypothetical protein